MDIRSQLAVAILFFGLGSHAAWASTWVVAQDGSGHFSTIQDAVDAAADGDLILVRTGVYFGLRIQGKSLTVIGEKPETTYVNPLQGFSTPYNEAIRIEDIPQGRVILSSLGAQKITGGPGPALLVKNCQAEIFLDRMKFHLGSGAYISQISSDKMMIQIADCRRVFLQRINDPFDSLFSGSVQVTNTDSLAVSQSFFQGKDGWLAYLFNTGSKGQTPLVVTNASVFLSHATLLGGKGGDSGWDVSTGPCLALPAGNGGEGLSGTDVHGLWAGSPSDLIKSGDGGGPGYGFSPGCGVNPQSGLPGKAIALQGASDLEVSGGTVVGAVLGQVSVIPPVPTLQAHGEAKLGGTLSLDLLGRSGNSVFLFVTDDTEFIPLPGIGGFPLFVSPGAGVAVVLPLGILGTSGSVSLALRIPNDPNLLGLSLFAQGLSASPSGSLQLTNLSFDTIRDH